MLRTKQVLLRPGHEQRPGAGGRDGSTEPDITAGGLLAPQDPAVNGNPHIAPSRRDMGPLNHPPLFIDSRCHYHCPVMQLGPVVSPAAWRGCKAGHGV